MCCVIGFAGQTREDGWGETYRLLTALMVEGQSRGTDASGYAAVTEPLGRRSRRRLLTSKAAVRAERFVLTPEWRRLRHTRLRSFVGHCRLATVGAADSARNAHPHSAADNSLHLVHNGHIRNWRSLVSDRGWVMRSECDSEAILRIVEDAGNGPAGLAEALRTCDGSIAALVLDAQRGGVIWLARNSASPLFMLRLVNDRRLFFASTKAILVRAFEQVLGRGWERRLDLLLPIASGYVHAVAPEGRVIAVS